MGFNSDGQLGVNIGENFNNMIKINTPTKVKKAVVSLNSIAYVDIDNNVYMIGIYGRNNRGEYLRTSSPRKVMKLENIKDIKAGEMHFLALDYDGNVWAWGENDCKQVSNDEYMQQWEPKKIEDLTGIEGIECGYYTSCAYKKDSAYIWGEDAFQLTDYNIIRDKYVLDINNIKEISMGRNHMVVRTLNQIFGYGSNSFGQMGDKEEALNGEEIEIENVERISCGITSTTFIIEGKVYYLGDINPFDDIREKNEVSLYNINLKNVINIECKAYNLIAMSNSNIEIEGYAEESADLNNANSEEQKRLKIALIDTGVDTSNEEILKMLNISNNDNNPKFKGVSQWNLCKGNNHVLEDASTDSHGTSMLGLLLGVQLNEERKIITSYQKDRDILILKVINGSGGRFIDVITAIRIAKTQNCKLVNCSFTINKKCYENILREEINNAEMFFVFSLNNNEETNMVLLELPNVLYVSEDTSKYKGKNCLMNVELGYVQVIGVGGEILTVKSNSCATAYVTSKIAKNYLEKGIELKWNNVVIWLKEGG